MDPAAIGSQPFQIGPLASHHDRAAFSCGEPSLDIYIQRQARQDVDRDLAACYILAQLGSGTIMGYYTISATSVALAELPESMAKTAGRYPQVPAVLIGRLAVARQFQGQNLSTLLLMNALRRTVGAGMGIKLIIVDAISERAAEFYERREFQRLHDNTLRLYLPVATARGVFPGEGGDDPSELPHG